MFGVCKILKINIVYASRYGSTKQVSELIGRHMPDGVNVLSVADAGALDCDVIILGSGIYANKMLPEMEDFISSNQETLREKRVGLFGVAMRTEPVERRGKLSGGVLIFDRYPLEPFIKGMLHGRRDFSVLTDEDRGGLERFYNTIGLSEEEKANRRKLCDEVSEEECAKFARDVISSFK